MASTAQLCHGTAGWVVEGHSLAGRFHSGATILIKALAFTGLVRVSPLWPNYLQRPLTQTPSLYGLGLQHMDFGAETFSPQL